MFSLESPYRGDSKEYIHHTIINNKKKKIILNYPTYTCNNVCTYVFCFSKGLKNEFETAMVNETSVLEPLKFFFIGYKKELK